MNYSLWAEWYDVIYSAAPPDEAEFYLELYRNAGGSVLEVGVGTGRIAIPAAKAGAEVVGVDLSQEMLDVAHRKALAATPLIGSLQLVRADMRRLDMRRKCALVTIPARTLLLATTAEDQVATLCCAARHLAPGARLVFNAFVPDPELIADRETEPFKWGETVHPETGNRCEVWAVNQFDTRSQLNHGGQIVRELAPDGSLQRSVELDVLLRYLYPTEAVAMVEEAGLRVVEIYGGFDRSPLSEDSEEMVFVCERA